MLENPHIFLVKTGSQNKKVARFSPDGLFAKIIRRMYEK